MYEKGRYEEARTAFGKGVEIEPTGYFYYELGRTLRKIGDLGEARIALLEAIRLEPEGENYLDELRRIEELIELEKEQNGSL